MTPTTRRAFLLAAPAVSFAAKTYSWTEIERMLARGDIAGRLTREDLPTPALLLDLDAFESNVAKMAKFAASRRRALRPHAKTHKCPEIARKLSAAGAVGHCTAKIGEAEVFAREGIGGLLITTAVIGKHKIERAVRLAQAKPDTILVLDNAQNATELNEAAARAKIRMKVAIDLLVGGRTGITPLEPAVALAERIASLSSLQFAGLQAYAGHASHTLGFDERTRVSRGAMAPAVETRRMIEKKGIECPWLSGGSTGTYNIDSEIDGITELQPGSYMFMDVDYSRIGGAGGSGVYADFQSSLTVVTTVVSKPTDAAAIVDGGFKAFSTDRPFPPESKEPAGVKFSFAGDEHGKLTGDGARALSVGNRLEFVIPHCDPTVNLYDRIFCLRGDRVEAAWKISARGMSQ